MENINIDNLKILNVLGWGAYGIVYNCKYKNRVYAFKEFRDPNKIFTSRFKHKINSISEFNINKSIVPEKMVLNSDETPLGYLTKRTEKFEFHDLSSLNKKIECLQNIKQSILELHEIGVIHTDIHSGNFLKYGSKFYLCDFDNCAFNSYRPLLRNCSEAAYTFIKEFGLIEEIDVYLLNLLTFAVINNVRYDMVEYNVFNNEYGNFDNNDARSICDSLLLESTKANDQFLLDNIDIKKLRKR